MVGLKARDSFTPSIYSLNHLEYEVLYEPDMLSRAQSLLGVKEESKGAVKDAILRAARDYTLTKSSYLRSYRNPEITKRELSALRAAAKEFKRAFSKVFTASRSALPELLHAFHDELIESDYLPLNNKFTGSFFCIAIDELGRKNLRHSLHDSGSFLAFIELIEKCSRAASNSKLSIPVGREVSALDRWLETIFTIQHMCSVRFIQGEYLKGAGYKSVATSVLTELIRAVDPSVLQSSVANSIKKHNTSRPST